MAFRTQKISQMTPKGSDLEATDLIEVSTIESGSYVTRSITGQEIIDAAVGNVDWGDIGGTLSAQTDLNTALSGKVPTSRTLTINGTTQDLSADRTFTISTGITIGTTAITSGTVGRVLFEGTGNVVQESANLFWDNTNGRLGIGGVTPYYNLIIYNASAPSFALQNSSRVWQHYLSGNNYRFGTSAADMINIAGATGNVQIGTNTDAGFRLDVNGTARVRGTGTTSATTAFTVQNSAGSNALTVKDDFTVFIGAATTGSGSNVLDQFNTRLYTYGNGQVGHFISSTVNGGTGDTSLGLFGLGTGGGYYGGIRFFTSSNSTTPNLAMIVDRNQSVGIGLTNSTNLTVNASAKLQIDSTTKGFLPPRMDTTQKNAIATPATGLMVYDTTLNLISVYNGTTWITL